MKKTAIKPNNLLVTVETSTECNVNETIREEIEKALQSAINQLSKDYFRTIKATVNVEVI